MNEKEKKELFVALVKDEGVWRILREIINAEEDRMATNGGEPDLMHLLMVRLLEANQGNKSAVSLVNDCEWKIHALKEK